MPAEFAKMLRGRAEVFVGISGIVNSSPQRGGSTSEEHLSEPEVKDGFLTGLSMERGGPGDPLRVMIPLERVAYIAFWERTVEDEKGGAMKRVELEKVKVEGGAGRG